MEDKAGFISKGCLPYFANLREKVIMDFYLGEESTGEMLWKQDEILSTDLKKMAGFGKDGLKNYPGIITGLQMQLYLVITDFRRRKNKKETNMA